MAAERIGVVGTGTMGAGIAQIAALGGLETFLHDPDSGALDEGMARIGRDLARGAERSRWGAAEAEAALSRLKPASELADLSGCEVVIEAAPEQIELKRELFAQIAGYVASDAVIATNTSSLSVTAIATTTDHPGRVVGMHFFNPPPLMRLVEIVAGDASSADALQTATEVGQRMGRTPIRAHDGIGFLANRLARPYGLESLRLLGEGVADHVTIDRVLRTGAGFRMGPFELMDLVGIDVGLEVAKSFWEQSFHEPRWQPSPLVQHLVDAGRLGRKSGRGWYSYEGGPHRDPDPEAGPGHDAVALIEAGGLEGQILSRVLAQIVNEAHFAVAAGVGSAEDADTAMRLGFNWPKGPFEWGEELGLGRCAEILDALWEHHHEERYRVAPLLRTRAQTPQPA